LLLLLAGGALKKKTKIQLITPNEAIDNLSTLAEMDFNANTLLGVVDQFRFVLSDKDYSMEAIQWLAPENASEIFEVMKVSYHSIFQYLADLYENPQTDWNDVKLKKSLQEIMELVGEATIALDRYLALFPQVKERAQELEEYKDLKAYFLERISEKFEGGLEGEKEWAREWVENEEALNFDLERRGLKDFETVRRDREYELFYIRDENDRPFFTTELLRNIKLVCDFDAAVAEELMEDPLLKIREFQDKDVHSAALQILHLAGPFIRNFYKSRVDHKEHELAAHLNKALIALMLTANEKNLLVKTVHKNSLLYFEDFQTFLRQAITCSEYAKLLAYGEEEETPLSKLLLELTHHLCKALYTRTLGIKEEMVGFVYHLIHKGQERKKEKTKEGDGFLGTMIEKDDSLRFFLRFFPNGPIFKDLDVVRSKEIVEFDPIFQKNLPMKLYSLRMNQHTLQILKIPSPTVQEVITKAKMAPEFLGFLRADVREKHPKKHLMIQLQDKTSWKEFARVKLLEDVQREAEWKGNLIVLTLSKDTDFYFQNGEYLALNSAKDFMALFVEQIQSNECGFYLPPILRGESRKKNMEKLLGWIHENFFENKEMLSRKNRLDFIEIFYHFFLLQLLAELSFDSISFTCKDALDVGGGMNASFYAFVKLLTQQVLVKEDEERLFSLFYTSCLLVRERAIDPQRMYRLFSALAQVESSLKTRGKQILKEISSLYGSHFGVS
jgi:hypothetical protein